MTVHPMEEMAEDDLDILDVEQAVLKWSNHTKREGRSERHEVRDRRTRCGRRDSGGSRRTLSKRRTVSNHHNL